MYMFIQKCWQSRKCIKWSLPSWLKWNIFFFRNAEVNKLSGDRCWVTFLWDQKFFFSIFFLHLWDLLSNLLRVYRFLKLSSGFFFIIFVFIIGCSRGIPMAWWSIRRFIFELMPAVECKKNTAIIFIFRCQAFNKCYCWRWFKKKSHSLKCFFWCWDFGHDLVTRIWMCKIIVRCLATEWSDLNF